MAKLIYSTIASLDGYIADEHGNFDWAAPDLAVHLFINDLERPIGTYLLGRRMYEVMAVWDSLDNFEDAGPAETDYASIWQSADKIVYSTTLASAPTAKTRIERAFDADVVRELKEAAASDITVGGAELAGEAIRAGLVDEYEMFLVPAVVGGGTKSLPDDVRLDLELLDEHRFDNGTMYLRYRTLA